MFRTRGITVLSTLAVLGALTLVYAQVGAGTTPATAKPAAAKTVAAKPAAAKHVATPKVDINAATRDDLMKLPGIGDALADKIVAARPFKSKSELLSKQVLTKKEYSTIASRIVAKQEASTSGTSK